MGIRPSLVICRDFVQVVDPHDSRAGSEKASGEKNEEADSLAP
jgi:hypothetical protein